MNLKHPNALQILEKWSMQGRLLSQVASKGPFVGKPGRKSRWVCLSIGLAALTLAVSSGGGHGACLETDPGTGQFSCSGVSPGPIIIDAPNASVSTEPGFVSQGGFFVFGTGALNFADENNSELSGAGLFVVNDGPIGGEPGSVNIVTTGPVSAGAARDGILVSTVGGADVDIRTDGSVSGDISGIRVNSLEPGGSISIETNGEVTSTTFEGAIRVEHYLADEVDITVRGEVNGAIDGIWVVTERAPIKIETTGDVTGRGRIGIWTDTGGTADIIVASEITGIGGPAIFAFADEGLRLELRPGFGFNGQVVTDQDSGAQLVFGGSDGEMRFDLSELQGGANESFSGFAPEFFKQGESRLILSGENANSFEQAAVEGGLTVLDAARLRMDGAQPFLVGGGGSLGAIGGGSQVVGNLTNLNAIVLSDASPFGSVDGLGGADDVLTVTGDYQAGSDAALYIDTVLNDGSTHETDQLVVEGDTSGTTIVYVNHAGGSGGLTGDGPTDGIMIVDVGGASDGEFVLAGPVQVGAFDYHLAQADGQNWFLQTSLADQSIIHSALPFHVKTFGRETIGSIDERMGARNACSVSQHVDDPNINCMFGTWARVLGAWSDAGGAIFGSQDHGSYTETVWALQGGIDATIADLEAGRLSASAFLHFGKIASSSVNETIEVNSGSVDADAWGGGGSLTYLGRNGLYLDGVATYVNYDFYTATTGGDTGSTDGYGWAIAGEAGWSIPLSDRIVLTPQGQFIYQDIVVDGFTDSSGLFTQVSQANSLEGRVGAKLGAGLDDIPENSQVYAEASLIHEFLDQPVTTISGTALAYDFDATSYELGVGGQLGIAESGLALWAEADYRAPFGGGGLTTWQATTGGVIRF